MRMPTISKLETERLLLLPSHPRLAKAIAGYFTRNRTFLRPFEPIREDAFFSVLGQRKFLKRELYDMAAGNCFRFWTAKKSAPNLIIGSVALSGIVMGSFQSAYISYRSDVAHINQGYTSEALARLVRFAFHTLRLHRLEANIMPRNKPSLRVVEKLGFENEGLARAYLNINGVWEDHVHMVKININFPKGDCT